MSWNPLALWRAEAAFDPLLAGIHREADRSMLAMCFFLQVVCLALAPLRGTGWAAVLVGGSTLALAWLLTRQAPGRLLTRLYMGCAFMAYTGLIIHQTATIEGHFSAFGLIGCLLFYRDWRTILVATLFIYLHHLILGYAQHLGGPVWVFDTPAYWGKFGLHVAYFLPFIAMMLHLAVALRRQGVESQRVRLWAERILAGDISAHLDLHALPPHSELLRLVVAMRNRLMELVHSLPVAIAVVRLDTQRVAAVNERWQALFPGPHAWEGLLARELPCWSDEGQWPWVRQHFGVPGAQAQAALEMALRRPQGAGLLGSVSAILHAEGNPPMLLMAVEDITRRRQAEDTLKRLAYQDLLTGLANRAQLMDVLNERLAHWREGSGPAFEIVLLDLDGFKEINDRLGHDAGDEVLRTVGQRLLAQAQEGELPARLGGDEFCVVLPAQSASAALERARAWIATVGAPVMLARGTRVQVGASAGHATVQALSPTEEVDALLKMADVALYAAKAAGKGTARSAPPQLATVA